jgi:endoglucanase
LAGSLNGTSNAEGTVLYGAVVDGPSQTDNFSGLGIPSGANKCPNPAANPFSHFTGEGVEYMDNVIAWPSVEPADDYTVLSLLAFARASIAVE